MDFKDRMIEAVERGQATEAGAYEYVREAYMGAWDDWRTRAKERGWRNPAIAGYFCKTCHWSENAHPRFECETDFKPETREEIDAHNRRLGF